MKKTFFGGRVMGLRRLERKLIWMDSKKEFSNEEIDD